MSKYVDRVLAELKEKNANEPEFLQTAEEVLSSLGPVVDAHPEYEKVALLERMVEQFGNFVVAPFAEAFIDIGRPCFVSGFRKFEFRVLGMKELRQTSGVGRILHGPLTQVGLNNSPGTILPPILFAHGL